MLTLNVAKKIVCLEKEAVTSHIKRHVKNLKSAYLRIFLNELFLIATKTEPSHANEVASLCCRKIKIVKEIYVNVNAKKTFKSDEVVQLLLPPLR